MNWVFIIHPHHKSALPQTPSLSSPHHPSLLNHSHPPLPFLSPLLFILLPLSQSLSLFSILFSASSFFNIFLYYTSCIFSSPSSSSFSFPSFPFLPFITQPFHLTFPLFSYSFLSFSPPLFTFLSILPFFPPFLSHLFLSYVLHPPLFLLCFSFLYSPFYSFFLRPFISFFIFFSYSTILLLLLHTCPPFFLHSLPRFLRFPVPLPHFLSSNITFSYLPSTLTISLPFFPPFHCLFMRRYKGTEVS